MGAEEIYTPPPKPCPALILADADPAPWAAVRREPATPAEPAPMAKRSKLNFTTMLPSVAAITLYLLDSVRDVWRRRSAEQLRAALPFTAHACGSPICSENESDGSPPIILFADMVDAALLELTTR
jgi:hypothetical protein